MGTEYLERRAIISGVGLSDIGRRLGRGGLDLALDAAADAIADAGLTAADIDGVATMGQAHPNNVVEALDLACTWVSPIGPQGPGGHLRYVVEACMAVATGLCRHVLVYRSVSMLSGEWRDGVTGDAEWHLPFYDFSAATMVAMHARRHMRDYGTTREQLGAIAVTTRSHAALNPKAIKRQSLTMDDYLSARWIAEPLGLYDCDLPVDAAAAFIVSVADYAQDCPNRAVRFESVGGGARGRMSWDQRPDYPVMGQVDAADMLWSRTELEPQDVDVAEIYDGFTFLALSWLESLGFCKRGEGGSFVEGGHRIRLGGELPMNTYGGQLSAGRLHGYWLLHEAVLQLQGRAGPRQVAGAEVALAAAGGGSHTGCLLLTR